MSLRTELSFDSGYERATLISLEHVVVTASKYFKKGIVLKMSDWMDLAEYEDSSVVLSEPVKIDYPPLPPSPPTPAEIYPVGTTLYWTVDRNNYSIAVVRKDGIFEVKRCDNSVVLTTLKGSKELVKSTFYPSVEVWKASVQDGGNLAVTLPSKRQIVSLARRHCR
jgi:hypothetical protein